MSAPPQCAHGRPAWELPVGVAATSPLRGGKQPLLINEQAAVPIVLSAHGLDARRAFIAPAAHGTGACAVRARCCPALPALPACARGRVAMHEVSCGGLLFPGFWCPQLAHPHLLHPQTRAFARSERSLVLQPAAATPQAGALNATRCSALTAELGTARRQRAGRAQAGRPRRQLGGGGGSCGSSSPAGVQRFCGVQASPAAIPCMQASVAGHASRAQVAADSTPLTPSAALTDCPCRWDDDRFQQYTVDVARCECPFCPALPIVLPAAAAAAPSAPSP